MNITFPDGSVKQFEDGMTALQIAETISQKLKKATLAAEIDGQRADAFRPIHGDHTLKLLTWQDEDGRWTMRHTASHILAQAVKHVHPEASIVRTFLLPCFLLLACGYGRKSKNHARNQPRRRKRVPICPEAQ